MAAFLRLRFTDAAQHIHSGEDLRDAGKLQDALAEFRMAEEIDPSNFEAMGQVRRVTDLIQKQFRDKETATKSRGQISSLERDAANAAGPVTLELKSDVPVSFHMTANTDAIYKTIGKMAGLNILIDPEYKPQKITFEVNNVSLHQALSMVAIQSKTFWRPLSSNTIIVTADSSSKRKELDQNVMRTFYLRNAATPADLQEAASTLKGVLDITHIQATPELRSLTLRGTPDQMVLAQKLLTDIDKPKAEVVIEVLVMEVSRERLHTFGTVPPTRRRLFVRIFRIGADSEFVPLALCRRYFRLCSRGEFHGARFGQWNKSHSET
jgi:general secretion pathway protein D